jgi:uncharacterized membrane protein (DUF2068 family)
MNADFVRTEELSMNRSNWMGALVGVQLISAFLLFAFSIYLAVVAYPLVVFFGERSTTIAYIGNVAVFDVLGVLALVGWWGLRRGRYWSWWLALCASSATCLLLTLDCFSLGLQQTYFQPATIALLSAIAVVLLLTPAVRKHYCRRSSLQVVAFE